MYNSDSGSLFILVVHNSIGDNGAMIVLIKAKVPIDAQFPCVNIQARPIVDPCKGVKDMWGILSSRDPFVTVSSSSALQSWKTAAARQNKPLSVIKV